MSQLRYILFVLLFLSILPLSGENILEQKAEKAYAEKNYKEAITLYESISKGGFISYKLYYNLGNAYYKNNELGKAIYNYELANKLQPNHTDIKTNLRIANEKTIDKIESKENFFIGALKTGIVYSLSTTAWAWFSIISLSGAFIFAFIFFISRSLMIKRITFFLGLLSFITCGISLAFGSVSLSSKEELKFAVILNRESKIHEEPNIISKTKFSLHEGSKVGVLETNPEWTNIKLENGNEGWVKTAEVGLF
ncbi:MAG: tetratricopeptide repeat protein [Bacteroidota bacterium]|jgi:tetratricopeptide (TPR) repeat protein|nr:tetratricopeptide repeat protein [Bacteroidota bacterium]